MDELKIFWGCPATPYLSCLSKKGKPKKDTPGKTARRSGSLAARLPAGEEKNSLRSDIFLRLPRLATACSAVLQWGPSICCGYRQVQDLDFGLNHPPPSSDSAGDGESRAETDGQMSERQRVFARPALLASAPGTCVSRRESVGRLLVSFWADKSLAAGGAATPRS
jgi:hypothetical protein